MAPYKVFYDKVSKWYFAHEPVVWLLIIAVPLAVLALGCLVAPSTFWDGLIWKYYWGPVEADAHNHPIGEVTEGYNIVSTLSYGLILSVAVFGIYRLFRKLHVKLDVKFFVAMVPFLIVGGIWRALEDSEYFRLPIKYLFIAPNIYIFEGILTIGIVVFSVFFCRYLSSCKSSSSAMLAILLLPAIFLSSYFVLAIAFGDSFVYMPNIFIGALVTILPFACFAITAHYKKYPLEKMGAFDLVLLFGLTLLSMPIFLVAEWFASPCSRWFTPIFPLEPAELAIIPLLAITFASALYIFSKYAGKVKPSLGFFTSGTNFLIIFGQLLDASATFRALDFYAYGEKHVLPNFLIQATGTAAVMFPLKIIVVGLVLYLIDVEMKDDLKGYKTLVGLVKFAVLVLGFAPGVRDMLRLAMGV